MSSSEFAALLVLATAMSFTPGPNTTLSTAMGANHGLRHALPFCLAVPAGWSLLMLLCGVGLGALLLAAPALALAIKAVGLAYLLWLAWRLAAGGGGLGTARRLDVGFVQGVALQFVNIKAWMLALAMASGWVAPAGDDPAALARRLAIVIGVMVVFAFTSNFTYALAGSMLRRWLSVGSRLAWFNRCMAAVLVATALWMAAA